MKNLYFGPGGNPKPEAWMTLLAALACSYLAATTERPRKEIVFMTFLNDYLLKNEIKEIKISKDRRSEVFNHRAEIDTNNGDRLYMVLGSQESFLAKLDQIQRQMGKQPAEFIPVKYVNDEQGPNAFMFLMAGFVLPTIIPNLLWGESLTNAYFMAVIRWIDFPFICFPTFQKFPNLLSHLDLQVRVSPPLHLAGQLRRPHVWHEALRQEHRPF